MTTLGETFNNRSMELPDELLRGTSDVHIHSGPWLKSCPGRLDPFQIAEQARDAGMKALVFYDHTLGVSCGMSMLVRRQVPGIDIFGGIIMTTVLGQSRGQLRQRQTSRVQRPVPEVRPRRTAEVHPP